MIMPPVYPPFYSVAKNLNRGIVACPLTQDDRGYYTMDFDAMEKAVTPKTKLLILCHPHNPVGRAWKDEELLQLAGFCEKHGLKIVSDEIHCDIVFNGVHKPFFTVSPYAFLNTVSAYAVSKTFNLAGLNASIAVIPHEEVRNHYKKTMANTALGHSFDQNINALAYAALTACYRDGEAYVSELKDYLQGNFDLVERFLSEHLKEVKFLRPEATFLGWLDFSAYGIPSKELQEKFITIGKVGMGLGLDYGKEGDGFFRLNVGTTGATLQKGLEGILKTIQSIKGESHE